MEYISLKEAAEISGYAPDYVGQLIRAGKLPGKQVYSNVAWVTTEEAVRAYTAGKQSGIVSSEQAGIEKDFNYKYLKLEQRYQMLVKISLYGIATVLVVFAILLFYALSVSFDNKIQQSALHSAQSQQQK